MHAGCLPREIERLRNVERVRMRWKHAGERREKGGLGSKVNGVSVEGEIAFAKAVGEFLREEVRVGTFQGNYVLNLKDQKRIKSLREGEEGRKIRVMLVGASQVGRLGDQHRKRHGWKVSVTGCLRMEGENTEVKNMEMVGELGGGDGGPTNRGETWQGGRERILRRESGEWPCENQHGGKGELVDRVVDMVDNVIQTVGDNVTVVYLTMLPRFVRECCKSHMTDEDVWLLDDVRRNVNKDIGDRSSDRELRV